MFQNIQLRVKRLALSTIFTLIVILLYQFSDINLLAIDFPKKVRYSLFNSLRKDPKADTTILIVDIGYVSLEEVKKKLKVLESFGPKVIGVNLCNIKEMNENFNSFLKQSDKIIICDCETNSNKKTSRLITSGNEVTHFLTDKDSYFELRLAKGLTELKKRQNPKERINFKGKDMYYHLSINDLENSYLEAFKNQTIIVGFLRDSLVTPMNRWYGKHSPNEGDMSDAEISANIISTINKNEFINEVNPTLRVLIIICISLLNAILLRILRTRRDVLNILLTVIFFVILNGLSTGLIVLAFTENYYLNLDEITGVLLISAIVSVYWNTNDNRLLTQREV